MQWNEHRFIHFEFLQVLICLSLTSNYFFKMKSNVIPLPATPKNHKSFIPIVNNVHRVSIATSLLCISYHIDCAVG